MTIRIFFTLIALIVKQNRVFTVRLFTLRGAEQLDFIGPDRSDKVHGPPIILFSAFCALGHFVSARGHDEVVAVQALD